jgi:hypothetical protein
MDNNLKHSYHGRIYDNFLMHWKYIKREKVGGKWKYTYKDDKVTKARLNAAEAAVADRQAGSKRDKEWNTLMDNIHNVTDDGYRTLKKAWRDASKAKIETEIAKAKADREYDAVEKEYEDSFGHDVADFLNKSSDKIDKAKSWLEGKAKNEKSNRMNDVIEEEIIPDEVIKDQIVPDKTIPVSPEEREIILEMEKKASEKKELEAYETSLKATQDIIKSGVFDDMPENVLDDIALDAVEKLYPNMSLKEYRSFTKEQKQALACALYATIAMEAGVDPLEYAKKDTSERKNAEKLKKK